MRRAARMAVLAAILAVAASPAAALAADCPGSDLQPGADTIRATSEATLCLVNAERTSRGLNALTEQAQLTTASLGFSQLMVREKFFAHVGPDGRTLTDRLTTAGYLGKPGAWIVGENIAWGESYLGTPARIVDAWMHSEGHRENILSAKYDEIGIGIVVGVPTSSNGGATYTTDFGHREYREDPPQRRRRSRAPRTSPSRSRRSRAQPPGPPRGTRRRRPARPPPGARLPAAPPLGVPPPGVPHIARAASWPPGSDRTRRPRSSRTACAAAADHDGDGAELAALRDIPQCGCSPTGMTVERFWTPPGV